MPALENELEFEWNEAEEQVLEAGNWMNQIDLFKHQGKKYVKSLYQAIQGQCCRLQQVMETRENLLLGDEPASWRLVPSILFKSLLYLTCFFLCSYFFRAIAALFSPRHPLNPSLDSHPPKVSPPSVDRLSPQSSGNFKIFLNVVRASGIPVRQRNPTDSESRQRSSGGSSNMFMMQSKNMVRIKKDERKDFNILSFQISTTPMSDPS